MKPSVRGCMAYIAVHHRSGTFSSKNIPKKYRIGLSGLVSRGYIQSWKEDKTTLYETSPAGLYYAGAFLAEETQYIAQVEAS